MSIFSSFNSSDDMDFSLKIQSKINPNNYQFQRVLKVWQVHAGPCNLPSVVAKVTTNQLAKNWMKEKKALKYKTLKIRRQSNVTSKKEQLIYNVIALLQPPFQLV